MRSTAQGGMGRRRGAALAAGLVGGLMIVAGHAARELSIVSITREGTELRITWDGGVPPYQIETRAALADGTWQPVGDPTSEITAAVPAAAMNAFYRVTGQGAQAFAGADSCETCHSGTHTTWQETRHAHALATLQAIGQGANGRCIGCHTVGFGQPGGYVDQATTPHLAGVQCENCHGGAAEHAASPSATALRPEVDLSGELCGSCHTGAHHATYDEWELSRHSQALATLVEGGHAQSRCLPCHSQDYRYAVAEGEPPPTPMTARLSIECATCHAAHGGAPHEAQLRKSVGEVCGECHTQGEAPLGREPHHPQFEMLKGEGAYQADGSELTRIHVHSLLAAQEGQACAQCHVVRHDVEAPNEGNPNVTGHTFNPFDGSITAHQAAPYTGCLMCHTADQAHALRTAQQERIEERLAALAPHFDPASPSYIDPDLLSQLNKDRLSVASFNYHFVDADGSRGVHNPALAGQSLNVAETIITELVDR